MIQIRPARTSDIKGIRKLIDSYSLQRRLLSKETVTLYETVQEFTVAIENEEVVGCAGLHVLWEDLAEVRTVAVDERLRRHGIGQQLLEAVIERAKNLGIQRIAIGPKLASHGLIDDENFGGSQCVGGVEGASSQQARARG